VILPSGSLEPTDGTSPLSRQAVDEAMAKLDASARLALEIRGLTQRLAEQDKLLVRLRGMLEAEQEGWRLERDSLRYELTTQAHVVGELKRELAVTRVTLERQMSTGRGRSLVDSIQGEIPENLA